tara:strand:+ start:1323 stop:1850 length:528 start_codon:yes stop_codon:yes gene_type:complete
MTDKAITFMPLKADQESLIIKWLDKDHVKEWFHGQGLQNILRGVKAFIHNENPSFKAWVAYLKGHPFAFLMSFPLTELDRENPGCHQAKWLEKDKRMMGMDLLIGDENYLGKGLAKPLISEFLSTLHRSVDIIFIDPELANTRAIHVYEKAGFEKLEEFIATWHPVPHILMRMKR